MIDWFIKRFFGIGLLAMVAAMLAAVNPATAWETVIDEDPFDGTTIGHYIEDRDGVAGFIVVDDNILRPSGRKRHAALRFSNATICGDINDEVIIHYIFDDGGVGEIVGYVSKSRKEIFFLDPYVERQIFKGFGEHKRLRMRLGDECGEHYDMDFTVTPLPVME